LAISGRRRDAAKERFWRKLVNGFNPAQTTVRQWCADHGVLISSFYNWRRDLTRRANGKAPCDVSIQANGRSRQC
jgi:hypothetical protein